MPRFVGHFKSPTRLNNAPGSIMYEFPPEPWQSNTFGTVTIHIFWMLVGITLIALIFRPKRKMQIWDGLGIWIVGCVLHMALSTRYREYLGHPNAHPALLYMSWLSIAVALLWNWRRLSKDKGGSDVLYSFSTIVGSTLLFLCCLPMGHFREAAYRTQCKNNLKQLGLAFHNYHDAFERFPAQRSGQPPHSWRVDLLPFLDASPTYNQYDFKEKWNLGSNAEIAKIKLFVYQCPSNPFSSSGDEFPTTAYVGLVGPDSILQRQESLKLKEISDGTSNTLLVVEACGLQIPWCKPQDLQLTETELTINGPGNEIGRSESALSSFHQGGVQVVLADGAARFLSSKIDKDVLKALTTATGDDLIDYDNF